MTIAGFYLCPEGIVLGADSTASVITKDGLHFFNFTQKVFEVGEDSTLGLLCWGLGSLGTVSYRTLIADLADSLSTDRPTSVLDAAQRWTEIFWSEYSKCLVVQRCRELNSKVPFDPNGASPPPKARTKDEEDEFRNLKRSAFAGFCIGGYILPGRVVQAAQMTFDPLGNEPKPQLLDVETQGWYGVPNIINRLMFGADDNLLQAIMTSGKWTGTQDELVSLIRTQRFVHGPLPIRDAIDYVYSCIHSTIKALKFSTLSPVCGGPIEIAVITTDRRFRWVRHKPWDAAIIDGEIS